MGSSPTEGSMPVRVPAVLNELLRAEVSTHVDNPRIRRARVALAILWVSALTATCLFYKVPRPLWQILLWLAAAMLIASIANPLGWAKSMLLDWFPLYLMLVLYGIAWGLASQIGIRPHIYPQLWFDRLLFGHDAAFGRLQLWLWSGSVRVSDYAFWVVYISHFFVTIIVCAALWIKSRLEFLRYRRRVIATWVTALCVFAAYPTVPPWMAAEQGHLPAMTRVIAQVLRAMSGSSGPSDGAAHAVASAADGRISLYNPVAAVPSMHSALPALVALFFWNRLVLLRPLLVAYCLAMGFVLVYAGEHYVFDVLAGWACAAAVHFTCCRFESRRPRRTAEPCPVAGAEAAVRQQELVESLPS